MELVFRLRLRQIFKEKILNTGHTLDEEKRICVGMVFLPRTDYSEQEKCREILSLLCWKELLYLWMETSSNKP